MPQINPMQFLSFVKNGQNPQKMMLNFLQQTVQSSPVGKNLYELAQTDNTQGIEQFARNLCASRGVDFDTEFTNFRNQWGL